MKTIIKILLLSGILIIMASGCWEFFYDAPAVAVYKTKGDYFNYVSVGIKRNGELIGRPDYHNPGSNSISGRIKITEDDTIYARRAKLINGYIISHEIGDNSIFVDFTHKEYLKYEIENPEIGGVANSVLKDNILDDDPFLELYYDSNRPRRYSLIDSFSDTVLINQMIRNGELGKYFKRIK